MLLSDLGSSRSSHKDPFTNLPDEADSDEADEDPWDLSEVPNMDALQCLRKLKKVNKYHKKPKEKQQDSLKAAQLWKDNCLLQVVLLVEAGRGAKLWKHECLEIRKVCQVAARKVVDMWKDSVQGKAQIKVNDYANTWSMNWWKMVASKVVEVFANEVSSKEQASIC